MVLLTPVDGDYRWEVQAVVVVEASPPTLLCTWVRTSAIWWIKVFLIETFLQGFKHFYSHSSHVDTWEETKYNTQVLVIIVIVIFHPYPGKRLPEDHYHLSRAQHIAENVLGISLGDGIHSTSISPLLLGQIPWQYDQLFHCKDVSFNTFESY